jgi:hypothetical protein
MPEGVPNNPAGAAIAYASSDKTFRYANTAGSGTPALVVRDVVSSQVVRNAATGAVIRTDYINETQGVPITTAPTIAHLSPIPADGLLDMGDPVSTTIPDTVGGTASGALPAGTNYATVVIDQSQAGGVNYSVSATAPITGTAPAAGNFEIMPNGNSSVVSGADFGNLKFIAKDTGATIRVTLTPFFKFPKFS